MNTSRVGISALTLICAVALQVAQGATAVEARAACEAAQAKVAEAARSVEVAKDALAKAKADKATAPERVKELKGQLKAAEAALDENKSAAKKAIRAYEKVQADEAAAAKAKAKEEALKKAREEREAAARAKEAEAKARAEKKATEAKARAEERAAAERARAAEREAALKAKAADREAAAKAKEAAAKAKAEAEAAKEKAREEMMSDRARQADARAKAKGEVAKAREELSMATKALEKADDDLANAQLAESAKEARVNAEKDLAIAKESAEAANAAATAAADKVAAAEKAVAEARKAKDAAAVNGAEKALALAKGEYAKARAAADKAAKALRNAQSAVDGIRIPNALTVEEAKARLDGAYEDFRVKSLARDAAEVAFSSHSSERIVASRRKAVATADQARAYLEKTCPSYTFTGDTVWLASTDINGIPLCSAFIKSDCDSAISNATARAVQGGFFFAGFKDEGEADGKRRILVDKGRLGAINVLFYEDEDQKIVVTNSNYSARQIKRMMGNGRVSRGASEGEVFNFEDINERFTELNGHPDIRKANIEFSPSDGNYDYKREDGSEGQNGRAVTMDVKVTEEKLPLHLVLGIDNSGSVEGDDSKAYGSGNWMAHATAQYLNMWGASHIFTVNGSYALNGDLYGASAAYMIPRRDNGEWSDLNWTFHGGYTKVDEDGAVRGKKADGSRYDLIDVDGEGYFGGVQISKRLMDTGRSTLDLSLGVTYRYVESGVEIYDSNGNHQHYDYGYHKSADDVEKGYYIVPASVALMYSETALDSFGGRNYTTVEGVHSITTAGEDRMKGFRSTIDGDDYWLARAQFARIQLLGDWNYSNASGLYSLFFRADSQVTDDALVSAEQFAAGGHNSVRGYKERQFLGDKGATATLELRSPIFAGIFNRNVKNGVMPYDRWQFLAFVDGGYYSLEKGKSTNEDDEDFIYSVGVGFRLALGDHWQMRCDIGVPLEKKGKKDAASGEKEDYDIDSVRAHLSLQAQF